MLLEHAFITTDGQEEAFTRAQELLYALGFARDAGPSDTVAEFRRGLKNPARAKRVSELPQRVRLEYDRGRVTLAAAVEENRKAGALHRDMLLSLAEAVEAAVRRHEPVEAARLPWDAVHARIEVEFMRKRRHRRVLLVTLLVIILGLIGLIIWLATGSG